MVDSRQKGARAESQARDLLRKCTELTWQRVPGSGALHESHGLKGDLYVPNERNNWCVEVKHYAADQINTKLFTAKSPIFLEWWNQTIREAKQVNKKPLLLFKHDRSKWFIAYDPKDVDAEIINIVTRTIIISDPLLHISLAEPKLKSDKWGWISG